MMMMEMWLEPQLTLPSPSAKRLLSSSPLLGGSNSLSALTFFRSLSEKKGKQSE